MGIHHKIQHVVKCTPILFLNDPWIHATHTTSQIIIIIINLIVPKHKPSDKTSNTYMRTEKDTQIMKFQNS